jgi:hypothetical protein
MTRTFLLTILVVLVAAGMALAEVPRTMSYQGSLRNPDTSLVPDADYQLTFRIYDVATSGTALWTEVQTLHVTLGVFNAILGNTVALDLPFDRQYWLSTQVGAEAELSPRVQLAAAPFGLNADKVDGFHADQFARGTTFGRAGGGGTITLTTPSYRAFTVVLSAPYAAPDVTDIGFVHCIENDGVLAWQGIDGTGTIVRGTAPFTSTTTVLSIAGGNVKLVMPGVSTRTQLNVVAISHDVKGYIVF